MRIKNLNIITIKSELFPQKENVLVKTIDYDEFIVPLLDGDLTGLAEDLESMEKHTKCNFNYLFLCKFTNRYGLLYSESPITKWELKRYNVQH